MYKRQFRGNTIRTTVDDNGNPLFCAKDVATALGYANTNDAVQAHCRGVVIRYPISDSLGRTQNARFIREGDMYRLIASSKLPAAQQFESWVFDTVVPSIRQTGSYSTDSPEVALAKALLTPKAVAGILTELDKTQIENRQLAAVHAAGKNFMLVDASGIDQDLLKRTSEKESAYRKLWLAFFDQIAILSLIHI